MPRSPSLRAWWNSRRKAVREYQNTNQKTHTSRVRRKRQRLPSNGSTRTDATIRILRFHRDYCAASLPIECYEKVVKVKADVAAILNFFSRPQIEADHHDAAPLAPIGGMRKGGFSAAL